MITHDKNKRVVIWGTYVSNDGKYLLAELIYFAPYLFSDAIKVGEYLVKIPTEYLKQHYPKGAIWVKLEILEKLDESVQ